MSLGETILSRRKTLALTQEQVAERLGVTPQAVYKWEKDIACPDVQLLSPLARLYAHRGLHGNGIAENSLTALSLIHI